VQETSSAKTDEKRRRRNKKWHIHRITVQQLIVQVQDVPSPKFFHKRKVCRFCVDFKYKD